MVERLDGIGAVITGGGSGIGLATAGLLARDGAHVVIMGRSAERLDSARTTLLEAGADASRVTTFVGDVADAQAVVRAMASAAAAPKGLGIAVSAAGVPGTGTLLGGEAEEWKACIDTNLYGTLHTIRAAAEAMRDSGGAICTVSSNIAHRPARFGGAYCATKAGADALVSVAADELGPLGIRVNAVLPGLTETPMVDRIFDIPDMVDGLTAATPMGGWSQSEDVATVIRFLVGPESRRVTGEHIAVDGGQSARQATDMRPVAKMMFPELDPRLLQ